MLVDERSLLRLPDGVEPAEVAPHADAGITAYHAVKKLLPAPRRREHDGRDRRRRGRAHRRSSSSGCSGRRTGRSAIDTDERRRRLARELGADEVLGEQTDVADAVRELTNGAGADVVFDFVGTDATHALGLQMLARRGLYSIVGYGGTSRTRRSASSPARPSIAGNLVGNWIDLWELLAAPRSRRRSTLRTETHPLEDVNDVLDKLREGEVTGRAVLVP